MSLFGHYTGRPRRIAADELDNYTVVTSERAPGSFLTSVLIGVSDVDEAVSGTEEEALRAHAKMVRKYRHKAPPKPRPHDPYDD